MDTVFSESREALRLSGMEPPCVLVPHSASESEALYWATKDPDEIGRMIGLDMAEPGSYRNGEVPMPSLAFRCSVLLFTFLIFVIGSFMTDIPRKVILPGKEKRRKRAIILVNMAITALLLQPSHSRLD
jgi:hypothetical protein